MDLTPGQQRIREIVKEHLPEHEAGKIDKLEIYQRVIKQFSTDEIITSDYITGQPLGYWRIARGYKDWLYAHSKKPVELRKDFPAVKLDKFVYDRGGSEDKCIMPSYKGGVESNTTIWCLFKLAQSAEFAKISFSVQYCLNSGILTHGGDGNHRLLAHVLWGELYIKPNIFCLYEELVNPDYELNTALLAVDRLYQAGRTIKIVKAVDEAALIKSFATELRPEEKKFLAEYIAYTEKSRHDPLEVNTIFGLKRCLDELRVLRNRSKLEIWISKNFNKNRRRSDFQSWYEIKYVGISE